MDPRRHWWRIRCFTGNPASGGALGGGMFCSCCSVFAEQAVDFLDPFLRRNLSRPLPGVRGAGAEEVFDIVGARSQAVLADAEQRCAVLVREAILAEIAAPGFAAARSNQPEAAMLRHFAQNFGPFVGHFKRASLTLYGL